MAIGGISESIVNVAAESVALGVDPMYFLTKADSTEISLWVEVTNKAIELRKQLDENLAAMIAYRVLKGFGG